MRPPRPIQRFFSLVTALAVSAAASPSAAQEPQPREVTPVAEPETTEPTDVEDRLRRLEQRDSEREEELARALARVEELERTEEEDEASEATDEVVLRPLASVFSRAEVREGYEGIGAANPGCFPGVNDGACMRYRARVGLELGNLRISDDLAAGIRFQPQATGYWSLGGSGGVSHPSLDLYEGNLTLAIGSALWVRAGRLVLNYGDEMVVGPLGWHPAARSFDGALVHVQPHEDGIWVDAFWTLVREGGPGSIGLDDVYFYGLYAALGPLLGEDAALDAYAFGLQSNVGTDPTTGAKVDWSLLVHLGARLRYRIALVDVRVEGGLQVGRVGQPEPADANQLLAGHIDGEAGLNFLDDRLRVAAHGFYASGDDPTTADFEGYTQLFPTSHAFLGLSDVMGARTNVAGGALHLLGKPHPDIRISLDLHAFARPETTADSFAGLENDLHFIWLPGGGFKVRAMYGIFLPNEGFWGNTEAVHYVEVEVGYRLK